MLSVVLSHNKTQSASKKSKTEMTARVQDNKSKHTRGWGERTGCVNGTFTQLAQLNLRLLGRACQSPYAATITTPFISGTSCSGEPWAEMKVPPWWEHQVIKGSFLRFMPGVGRSIAWPADRTSTLLCLVSAFLVLATF